MERPPLGPPSRYLPPRSLGPHVGLTAAPQSQGMAKGESFPISALRETPSAAPPAQQVMTATIMPNQTIGSNALNPGSTTFTQATIGRVVVPATDDAPSSDKKKSKKEQMIEIDLTQIEDDQVRDMFSSLYAKIEAKQRDIVGLRDLKTRYISEGKDAFDREDLCDVEDELKLQEARLLAYEHKLRLRVNHFNSTILKLHKILFERRRILDEADDTTQVLTRNPDLLHRIVSKQLKLEEILEKTKKELSAGLMESDDEEEFGPRRHYVAPPPQGVKPKEWWEEDSVIEDDYRRASSRHSRDPSPERHSRSGRSRRSHHSHRSRSKSREGGDEGRSERRRRRKERHERRRRRKERHEERHRRSNEGHVPLS